MDRLAGTTTTMSLIAWLLRLFFFVAVLYLALKNTVPVTVSLTHTLRFDDVPLVVVMLICFVAGMLAATLALLPRLLRARAPRVDPPRTERPARRPRPDTAELSADRLAEAARNAGAVSDFDATQTRRR
jgi:uncharacterized integral membrane protein